MRYLSIAAVLTALAVLAFVGTDPTAQAQNPAGWGDVKGQVVWGGNDLPEVKKLDVTKDQEHCLARGAILSEEWVINPTNKGVRWAVVWLIPDPPDGQLAVHPSLQAVPKDVVVMDQPMCKFEPHVVALRQGQTLEVKNSAPIVHNVNWAGIRIRGDNKVISPNGSIKIDDLKATGFPVIIACNIHPWMKAYVRVFDHPYFAVTDENGRFEIKNAPAGKCRLVVWQETAGYKSDKNGDPITIQAGTATDVGKLELKPAK
ncbi:MAG TPA: hypothetical protein VNK04_17490 [Gemmataceae bacterium]|nr:hypothetical protein [Gemmataceae bacterium]